MYPYPYYPGGFYPIHTRHPYYGFNPYYGYHPYQNNLYQSQYSSINQRFVNFGTAGNVSQTAISNNFRY